MPVPGAAQQHSRLKRRTVLVLAMFGFSAVSTVYSLSRAATLWQLDRKVGRFGDPDRAVNGMFKTCLSLKLASLPEASQLVSYASPDNGPQD